MYTSSEQWKYGERIGIALSRKDKPFQKCIFEKLFHKLISFLFWGEERTRFKKDTFEFSDDNLINFQNLWIKLSPNIPSCHIHLRKSIKNTAVIKFTKPYTTLKRINFDGIVFLENQFHWYQSVGTDTTGESTRQMNGRTTVSLQTRSFFSSVRSKMYMVDEREG